MTALQDLLQRASQNKYLTPRERSVLRALTFFMRTGAPLLSLPFVATLLQQVQMFVTTVVAGGKPTFSVNWQIEGVSLVIAAIIAVYEGHAKYLSALRDAAKNHTPIQHIMDVLDQELTAVTPQEALSVVSTIGRHFGLTDAATQGIVQSVTNIEKSA